jgi:starch synthase
MPTKLRILFVVAETHPLVKTGGLADVVPALARALIDEGHDVRLLLPGYRAVEEAFAGQATGRGFEVLPGLPRARLLRGRLPGYDIPAWLVHCAPLYDRPGGPYTDEAGRDWEDNALRFGLLCKVGALFGAGQGMDGWRADVLHGHDWHAGLLPAYAHFDHAVTAATVFTIHNLAYQGNFPADTRATLDLPAEAFRPDGLEFYGHLNFMKAGLWYSDRLTTVSPTYARQILGEEYGEGMSGVLRARGAALTGILNGVDAQAWNPATDALLPARYSGTDMAGKARCKLELQDRLGLARGPATPVIGMVGRMTSQKGWDLLPDALATLAPANAQWALLGSGDRGLEAELTRVAAAHPGSVGLYLGYDEALSHLVIAGADIFAMPSRFEPSGLTQMYSQIYGTVPVVRRTGGLADSVVEATPETIPGGRGTGFLFEDASGAALAGALGAAVRMYRDDKAGWAQLQANGMRHEFGWRQPAAVYADVYRRAAALRGGAA